MPSVTVFNDNFEKAMRRFKKKVSNEKVLEDCKSKQYHEKPCAKRNRKKAAAIGRRKRSDSQEGRPPRQF